MKKIYCSDDLVMAGYLKSLLDADGIECFIKNQYLTGGRGDLPLNECWPEIWITQDETFSHAMKIITSAITAPDHVVQSNWDCICGETIEGQFDSCWNCGKDKPR